MVETQANEENGEAQKLEDMDVSSKDRTGVPDVMEYAEALQEENLS